MLLHVLKDSPECAARPPDESCIADDCQPESCARQGHVDPPPVVRTEKAQPTLRVASGQGDLAPTMLGQLATVEDETVMDLFLSSFAISRLSDQLAAT
jgi:hypothetical protein